jgi:chloramphenicol 3-O phosphotransferase
MESGKIILVNGASSSGKSTLCTALQAKLEQPFWHYSIDHILAAKLLPHARFNSNGFLWADIRPQFFAGFHQTLPALAGAGNNLIIEHIVETKAWMQLLLELLEPFDVFFVGVHCPVLELERRERARGDRAVGDAQKDFETVHTFGVYDLEVDSTQDLDANVEKVIFAWEVRKHPSAFQKMLEARKNLL